MLTIDSALIRGWAEEAGALAYSYFRRAEAWRKADGSPVTHADLAIERLLEERITAAFPDHGLLGEEGLQRGLEREYVWIIDPLDGTASFAAGLPLWAVSIGLFRAGRPLLGVIHLPVLNDTYWNDVGGGARLNGAPITVRPDEPFVGGDWLAVPSSVHRSFNVAYRGKVRVLGSVAADYCYVARGAAAGGLIGSAQLWDVAAGLAILTAAGGSAQYLDGTAVDGGTLYAGRERVPSMVIGAAGRLPALREMISRRQPAGRPQ